MFDLNELQKQRELEHVKHAMDTLRKRKRGGARTLRGLKAKKLLEVEYRNILREMVKGVYLSIKSNLYDRINTVYSELKTNSAVDIIKAAFAQIMQDSDELSAYAEIKATRSFRRMDARNKQKFYKQVKEAVGLDITHIINAPDVQQQIQLITAENFNLIKSLASDEVSRIKSIVYTQLSAGQFDTAKLRALLQKEYGVSKRRADFIASDQTHKINASLTEIRAKALGSNDYIWRTANDMHVTGRPGGLYPNDKPSHWAREGKTFSYNNPPKGGNPGVRPRCRCFAEPKLPAIFNA